MQGQSSSTKQTGELQGFLQRLRYALGPLAAGIVLDVLDFATFGPVGILAGAFVGGCAGWMLGGLEAFDRDLRIAFAICAAAYMTIPFTEPIPVATILFLLSRFFQTPNVNAAPHSTDTAEQHTRP